MDAHKMPESHFPTKQKEFLGPMTSLSTSTPVCARSKPMGVIFKGDKMSPASAGLLEHDSGYVDSLGDLTFLSDHDGSDGRLSAEIILNNTPVSLDQRSAPNLHLYSPISLCPPDCNPPCSTQCLKDFDLFDIPEDEFCSGFKEMSMDSFDLDSESGSKCNSRVSPYTSSEREEARVLSALSPEEPERFDKFLKHFSPREPDRLIGRKIGLDHVDIIAELHLRSIDTSLILSFLEPADLCRMCKVSRQWKVICIGMPSADRRRLEFVKKNKAAFTGKENYGRKLSDRQHRGLTNSGATLGCVQNIELQTKPPFLEISPNKQDISFSKAAQLLQHEERLCHCPKCHFASKVVPVEERGICFKCSYDFCIKCLTEYHQARPCVPVACKKAKTDNVGGKKSKRNLKRL
ncbi:F-box only protein 5-like [Gigantopelta aegis]|uniref:F-box only protein 5-like n=1 Tax=Gigantopelta aegis TaxID=1735272 RepID=UPI001B888489|nr:F-box only protein 5-like [Gigantopelta aegis]